MLFICGCGSYVAGIGLVLVGARLDHFLWLILAAALLFLCKKRVAVVAVPAVVAAGLIAGLWRGSVAWQSVAQYDRYIGQNVTIVGQVAEDTSYNDKNQLVFYVQNVHVNNESLAGKVRVTTVAPVEPERGDTVKVTGKLYDGFGNYQASTYFATVVIEQHTVDPILQLRRDFGARVHSLLPDTLASLGLGFLIGIKSQLPNSLNDELKTLGLTHIVVASGYNLTVLVRVARRAFAKISHFQTTAASLCLVAGFVAVTGFSPSMARAALVTSLAVLAWHYGRRIHPVLLLTFAAAITAAINPLYVWCDIGWWLSFLAFGGVLLLAPLVQHRIFGDREPKLIGQVVVETLCAQITTLPLILLVFGNLSVLSLVANVLVVPLIPLAMACTFAAGTIGAFMPYIAWPAQLLLGYICQIVHLLSGVSWASVPFTISPVVFVACYIAIVIAGVVLWRRTRHDYLSRSVVE